MKKALIIGCPGAGKTTFGLRLAEKTGLPLVHLDKLCHMDNWKRTISKEESDKLIQAELEKDKWIIDGNYNRTLPLRLEYCDTVFYFDFPAVVCLWGAFKRTLRFYGKTRDDVNGNCPERFDKQKINFFKFIVSFNKEHRKNIFHCLKKANVNTVIFTSRKQADEYLKNIEE